MFLIVQGLTKQRKKELINAFMDKGIFVERPVPVLLKSEVWSIGSTIKNSALKPRGLRQYGGSNVKEAEA